MTHEQALSVMQEVFNSMKTSGMFNEDSKLDADTLILGVGSSFDSLGFVTFISDLEERLSDDAGDDIYLVLDDISDFNINNPSLTVRAMTFYITELMNKEV